MRRHVWVSVTPDLRHDAARDLRDLGAANITVHSLVDMPADCDVAQWPQEGVMFLSYSALTAGAHGLMLPWPALLPRACGHHGQRPLRWLCRCMPDQT